MKMKINPIEEYFKDTGSHELKKSEVFEATEDNTDIKTDLTEKQIVLVNTLHENDLFLVSRGLKPVFKSYYDKYLRLLISKNRESRKEFVEVNKAKKDEIPEHLTKMFGGMGR
jgi:hypothetical protein